MIKEENTNENKKKSKFLNKSTVKGDGNISIQEASNSNISISLNTSKE